MPKTTSQVPLDWLQTVTQRQQLTDWKIIGRIGIQTEISGGSLDFFWKQQDDAYKIRLNAAMGLGTILIRGDGHGVYVRTKDGESYADTADKLIASSLGVNVPLSGLQDWLRGVPTEGKAPKRQLWDERGQLQKLVQKGWNIEMSAYKKVGKHMLPHAFYLDRDDQPELEIRLKIRQWTLPSKESS